MTINNSKRFKIIDTLLIVLTILPVLSGIVLKILTNPGTEGLSVTGAVIYFTIPMPFFGDMPITEAQVNSLIVALFILFLSLWLTHGIALYPNSKRQIIAEWIVTATDKLVEENMGQYFNGYSPFIGAIIGTSIISSLLTLTGLFPPTSDFNVILGWSAMIFMLITYYKLKGGLFNYFKGFTEPIVLFTPMNIISEFATPISMTFRHYGNVLSGSIISLLLAYGLRGLSTLIIGWIPVLGQFPLFRIGIPAVLSLYFDIFSGLLQAYIFAMLSMLYISSALPVEKWLARKEKKKARKAKENA
ncbi:MAG: F0F1 ATP synthase subunit A [Clostridia bacterium]|nr:F0F1 ATP synthase subunit A [Clostridia bacterium]